MAWETGQVNPHSTSCVTPVSVDPGAGTDSAAVFVSEKDRDKTTIFRSRPSQVVAVKLELMQNRIRWMRDVLKAETLN
jgi:hypothetical protein